MDQFKPDSGLSSVFEVFGFGAATLSYLWVIGTFDLSWAMTESSETLISGDFVLLLTSFAIFICYVVGTFISLFGQAMYAISSRKIAALPNNENTLLDVNVANEIDVKEFYRYRKAIEFFQGTLGLSVAILVIQSVMLFSEVSKNSITILILSLLFVIVSFCAICLRELNLALFVVSRKSVP